MYFVFLSVVNVSGDAHLFHTASQTAHGQKLVRLLALGYSIDNASYTAVHKIK